MLDLQTEQHENGQAYLELYEAVGDLKRRHDLHPCAVRPRDGLALRKESERETVADLVKRFRNLPNEQQRKLPALLNSLAQLEIVVGELEAGQHDFQEVARLVSDPISQAEAHHNVYRAALERQDHDQALLSLRRAVALDADAFEPFPLERYEPLRILDSSFGVTFLCRERKSETAVVVRSLRTDSLERELELILREFATIQELDQPTLLRICEMGYADPEQTRPFVVFEYFEGETLTEYVHSHGPLTPEDWFQIAWPVIRALQTLHGRGVLHRSLRPDCILIRRALADDTGVSWRVKILDAGLSIRRTLIHSSSASASAQVQTSLGRGVAGIVPYQPSEVIGRPKGHVWVGPHSDLYSFGKVCCFALTGRPDPDPGDRVLLSDGWNAFLEECTAWIISQRLTQAPQVMERLSSLAGPGDLISRIERVTYASVIEDHSTTLAVDPENLQALINRGNAYARQGDHDRAIADFTQALELKPNDAGLYRRRALSHSRSNRVDAAIADYTEALRLEPKNVEALANRGLVWSLKNEYARAIADYTEALKINPRDEVLLYNRGNAHFCLGEHAQAIADYSDVIRHNVQHAWALGNRGKTYALRGEHGKAVADFSRVLQLDPGNLKARWDRAQSYTELNQQDRAIEDYSEALRQQPSASLYIDRGLAQANQGRFDLAIADFTEAIALEPGNSSAFLFRGNARSDCQQLQEALTDLNEAIRLNPQSAVAWYNRGNVHGRLDEVGGRDQALADYTRALEIDPNYLAARFNRGNTAAEMGQFDEAIADYTAVLEINPRDGATLTNRGNAYGSLGELDLALADYSTAIELDPGDTITRLNRANTLARLRPPHYTTAKVEEALADYAEVLRLEPNHARAYNYRGNLYVALGNLDLALTDYSSAIRAASPNDHLAQARAYHNRGNIYAERGNTQAALADYNKAIELAPAPKCTTSPSSPSIVMAHYHRGNLHAQSADDVAALADYDVAIGLNSKHADAFNNRGLCQRRLGEAEKALDDFDQALALNSHLTRALFNRVGLLVEKGDLAQALADLDILLRLQPDDASAFEARADVHHREGNDRAAVADYWAALALAPDSVRVLNNLAWLLAVSTVEELRNPTEAEELARRACDQTGNANALCLDTHAATLANLGRYSDAIQRQRLAVEYGSEADQDELRERLAHYTVQFSVFSVQSKTDLTEN